MDGIGIKSKIPALSFSVRTVFGSPELSTLLTAISQNPLISNFQSHVKLGVSVLEEFLPLNGTLLQFS